MYNIGWESGKKPPTWDYYIILKIYIGISKKECRIYDHFISDRKIYLSLWFFRVGRRWFLWKISQLSGGKGRSPVGGARGFKVPRESEKFPNTLWNRHELIRYLPPLPDFVSCIAKNSIPKSHPTLCRVKAFFIPSVNLKVNKKSRKYSTMKYTSFLIPVSIINSILRKVPFCPAFSHFDLEKNCTWPTFAFLFYFFNYIFPRCRSRLNFF